MQAVFCVGNGYTVVYCVSTLLFQVLKPVDITLLSNKPYGEGQSIDIRVSPIILKVSPSIIQLLSSVSASFSAQSVGSAIVPISDLVCSIF